VTELAEAALSAQGQTGRNDIRRRVIKFGLKLLF
jgi:hypothetical protein